VPIGKAAYIKTQFVDFGFLGIDVIKNGKMLNAKFYANDGSILDKFTITKTK
jgi:hypothetical protein